MLSSTQRVVHAAASNAILISGLLSACTADKQTEAGMSQANKDASADAKWSLVLEDLPAALLSVSGSGAEDVWAVGALLDDEAVVLHSDGASWRRVRVGATADLWWVHTFDRETRFMAGDKGSVIRGEGEEFRALPTPDSNTTLYGIWGSSPDAIWAVGTDGSNGVIWRYEGGSFEPAAVDPALLDGVTLFKVWGRSADDVWIVGDQGVVLHYDGESVAPVDANIKLPLTTVHGTASSLYAVGGFGGAVIAGFENGAWVDLTPDDAPAFFGVCARGDTAYAVGAAGEVFKRTKAGPFRRVETGLDLAREYHAAWIDPDGGVWAVGGHVSDAPLVQGLLSYYGTQPPSTRAPEL